MLSLISKMPVFHSFKNRFHQNQSLTHSILHITKELDWFGPMQNTISNHTELLCQHLIHILA